MYDNSFSSLIIKFIILIIFSVYVDYSKKRPRGFTTPKPTGEPLSAAEKKKVFWDKRVKINKTIPKQCDKRIRLYKLNRKKMTSMGPAPADRSFVVQPIPFTNLILIVIDLVCNGIDPHFIMSTEPEIIHKTGCISSNVDLPRVRPEKCANLHTNVRFIKYFFKIPFQILMTFLFSGNFYY